MTRLGKKRALGKLVSTADYDSLLNSNLPYSPHTPLILLKERLQIPLVVILIFCYKRETLERCRHTPCAVLDICPIPARSRPDQSSRHTECGYYFGFLVRQYSYLDAIGYNTLIKSELSEFFPPSRLQRCRHTPYAVLDICPIPARSRPDQSSRHTECAYYFGFLARQYSYLDAIHYNT